MSNGNFGGNDAEVRVDAASVVVGPAARFTGDVLPVSLGFGAQYCLNATAGDLQLSGSFLARDGISHSGLVGTATGNVLADGVFMFAPNGCIALTAGGTLDTANGTFDLPLSPACPALCQ